MRGGDEKNFSFFGKIGSLLKSERDFLYRKQMFHPMFCLTVKYPSFLKGRFQGVQNFYFSLFGKISGSLKLGHGFLFIVTMRSSVGGARRIANQVAEKMLLIPLREKLRV